MRQETAEAKAQRIIREELARLGWNPADLASGRKGDPSKLQLAARLWRETTLCLREIAGCLHLGTARSASVRLHTAMSQASAAQAGQGHFGI